MGAKGCTVPPNRRYAPETGDGGCGHRRDRVDAAWPRHDSAAPCCRDHRDPHTRATSQVLALSRSPRGVPRRTSRTHPRRHRSATPVASWSWRGIPVLSPAALLVDLARTLAPADLARACHEAGVRCRTTPPGRGRAENQSERSRSRRAPRNHQWKREGQSQQARGGLPRPRPSGSPATSADQQAGRHQARRLSLARASPDRRARQLSLPQLAPRLGARPSARTRSHRARGSVSPLHLRRRVRHTTRRHGRAGGGTSAPAVPINQRYAPVSGDSPAASAG